MLTRCLLPKLKDFTALFFLIVISAVTVPHSFADSDTPVLLFFSGNIQGETEPCG